MVCQMAIHVCVFVAGSASAMFSMAASLLSTLLCSIPLNLVIRILGLTFEAKYALEMISEQVEEIGVRFK